MANFSTDADLLAFEPHVFCELPFASQRLLRIGDGVLSGAELSSATGGLGALAAGNVVVISPTPAEAAAFGVAAVTGDTQVVLDAAPVGLSASAGLAVTCCTFAPQARLVHDELLRAIGMDPDDPDACVDESAIVSTTLMKHLECLGTLGRAYAGAIAVAGDNAVIEGKAKGYQQRFARACAMAQVLLDLDGDGRPDAWRSPGVARLVRG